jgi:hypothetical protein
MFPVGNKSVFEDVNTDSWNFLYQKLKKSDVRKAVGQVD